MMADKQLTNKQRVFVNEYLIDLNATQAAIRAGYSENSARMQASHLLTKVNISEAIEKRLAEKSMSADEVITRLTDMGRGDMGDFLDIESMSYRLNLEKAKELGKLHLIKKIKERTVMTSNKQGEETETHTFEIELYDAQAALALLGKYHGLFIDKQQVDANVRVEIIDQEYPDSTTKTTP